MKYIRQMAADVPLYERQDTCVICGKYMVGGSGMVCPNCISVLE